MKCNGIMIIKFCLVENNQLICVFMVMKIVINQESISEYEEKVTDSDGFMNMIRV